jgi:hypothetical protein
LEQQDQWDYAPSAGGQPSAESTAEAVGWLAGQNAAGWQAGKDAAGWQAGKDAAGWQAGQNASAWQAGQDSGPPAGWWPEADESIGLALHNKKSTSVFNGEKSTPPSRPPAILDGRSSFASPPVEKFNSVGQDPEKALKLKSEQGQAGPQGSLYEQTSSGQGIRDKPGPVLVGQGTQGVIGQLDKAKDKVNNEKMQSGFVPQLGMTTSSPIKEKGPIRGQGSLDGKKVSSGGHEGPQGQWLHQGGQGKSNADSFKSSEIRQGITGLLMKEAEARPLKSLIQNKEQKASEKDYRNRFGGQEGEKGSGTKGEITKERPQSPLQRPEKPAKLGATEGRREILASALPEVKQGSRQRLPEKKEDTHKVKINKFMKLLI